MITRNESPPAPLLAGLILAGGEGRRMDGEDKGLLRVANLSFAQHLAARIAPRVKCLAISANRNLSQYRRWADAVVSDSAFAGQGPLAGLLAGLEWAQGTGASHLLVSPCDTPALGAAFFQALIQRMQADPQATIIARVEGQVQPLHALFLIAGTLANLRRWLESGRRDARGFVSSLSPNWLECDAMAEEFLNVNRPEDLAQLGRQLR